MRLTAITTALLCLFAAAPVMAQEPQAAEIVMNEQANEGLWNTGLALTIGGAVPILAGVLVLGIGFKDGCSDGADCGMSGGVMSIAGGALIGLGLAGSITGLVLLKFAKPGKDDSAQRNDDNIALSPWIAPRVSSDGDRTGALLGVTGTF
ncbi:MAG: hypothetical protein PHU25_22160 [Deltaproteobacteria bacterium]|nr:hypothetical protein [Deltaproteobacteria bacterium]